MNLTVTGPRPRRPAPGDTFDEANQGGGRPAGERLIVQVAERGNIPTATATATAIATAIATNLTATGGRATGYATVHPCLDQIPTTADPLCHRYDSVTSCAWHSP